MNTEKRLLECEVSRLSGLLEMLRSDFKEIADALGCDVKDNQAMLEKIAMLKVGPVTADLCQIFIDRFDSLIEERDADIGYCKLGRSNYQALINAARFAFSETMLAAAPQPQNAQQNIPENIPGSWIKCSERMPAKNDRDIWLWNGGGKPESGYIWNGESFVDWNEEYMELDDVTHWMPMNFPSAPEQEV